MTQPEPMSSGKQRRHGHRPQRAPQPQLHQALVTIDVRNLAAANPDPKAIEELIDRVAAELRRCTDHKSRPVARMARMAAPPPTGGKVGGRTGTDDENTLIDGCVLTAVTQEQVMVNGEYRWVRVEHYTCPNGETYYLRT